jgi:glutamyl-tRNA synthetase
VGGKDVVKSPHQNSEESFGSPSRGEQVGLPLLQLKNSNNLLADALAFDSGLPDSLLPAIESVKSKASTLVELREQLAFYLTAPTSYDEKAAAILAKNGANIALILPALEALAEPWSTEGVKAAINNVAEQTGKKIGEIMPPMRAALVGAMSGPDVPVIMAILGKTESIKRLKTAINA